MNKKYIIYIITVVVLIIVTRFMYNTYQFAKGVEEDIEKHARLKDTTHINIDTINHIPNKEQQKKLKALLNGVWAENEEDNALFQIEGDTLRYVEHYNTPYLAFLNENYFEIRYLDNKVLSKSIILKLTKDSLILKTAAEEPLRLFNRSE